MRHLRQSCFGFRVGATALEDQRVSGRGSPGINYLFFELEQPTSAETEAIQYKRIKQVHDDIRRKSHLPPLTTKDLSHYYMVYLLERGTKEAVKEYMTLDREVNG